MSLIVPRNFKRAKAQDAANSRAANAKFKVGDKVKVYHGTKVGTVRSVEESMRGPFYEVQLGTLHGVPYVGKFDERELVAANDRAADAQFKIGDKVKLSGSHPRSPNKVGVVTHVFPTGFVKVKVDGVEDIEIAERLISKAEDSAAKFQKGDKVRVWQYPVYGKLGEVVEATYGGMEYTVRVEGKEYPRIDYRRIVKVTKTAGDSAAMDAKFKVGDRVKYTGHTPLVYGKTGSVGTIRSVDTTLFEDGYPLYEVEFQESRYGTTDLIGEEHLRRV